MNRKRKGITAERELLHKFWKAGWACVRIAGSGSIKYPMPDVIASNGFKQIAIEIKNIGSDYKYFPKKEIKELIEFSQKFGAIPFVAVKFSGKPWLFLSVDDLKETKQGFAIQFENEKAKGFSFEELIEFFDKL
ncbi:MAG: holliday junction resolvase Hjr [Candidatus Woesearchaeota archaeon]|nr:holliday junction resolvase Hjr [Candidatus Woesearchaeota archaeon]MDN5328142.1 holliday junction resolvase Hjr [Candidatus Woesearchaeota archaeon]